MAQAWSNEICKQIQDEGFPGGSAIKNLLANAGNRVGSLIWEGPTCHRATKPVHHSYRACALERMSCNY